VGRDFRWQEILRHTLQLESLSSMSDLFMSGRIVDLILALLVVELVALYWYRRMTGGGIPVLDILMNNLAGAGLLLALRAALTGGAWTTVAPWLLAAFAAHIADVVRRWPKPQDRHGQ
jgi:hypothetical protein